MSKRGICFLFLAFVLGMSVCGNAHAVVIEDSLVVTDVTPVQFCVVWGTTEPANATVNVFQDPAGQNPETKAIVTFESRNHPPAEDIGVMKAKVMGLKPDTEYFFQTETILKSSNSVLLSSIQSVKTEKSSIIVRNDVLAPKVSVDGVKPALGMLVIAILEGASYPVSGWVADGMPEQWSAVDSNNFYDKTTHVNLELQGGEIINLMLFGGSLGYVETQTIVPVKTGGIQSLKAVSLQLSSSSVPSPAAPSSTAPPPAAVPAGGEGGCFISTILGER